MSAPVYTEIVRHYEQCLEQHGDSHLGVDWPNAEDAQLRYDIMLDVMSLTPDKDVSLLDFGCGTAALYDRLRTRNIQSVAYSGLDISPRFVEVARSKFPQVEFRCLDVLEHPEQLAEYDYVIMNGVFHEKLGLSDERMFEYVSEVLRVVFDKTRRGLAFSVMSKHVDWERDDLFHVPYDELTTFLTTSLSRRFVLRADYGLWEYTAYVYRDPVEGH